MQILYFYQYFTTPKGSYGTRVYENTRRWVEAGHKVTVVTTVYDKSDLRPKGFLPRLNIDGVDVRVVNIRVSNKHGMAFRLLTFVLYSLISCWYALTLKADVVVCSSPPITIAFPGLVARYLRRRKLVFEVRDLWPDLLIEMGALRSPLGIRILRWFEEFCYRSSALIVAVSEGMERLLRERGFTHVAVVPNAADNRMYEVWQDKPAALPEWTAGRQLVLYTGTMGRANGCRILVEAARYLREWNAEGIALVLLGDGAQRTELMARSHELDLKNIHFPGQVPKQALAGWMRAASAAVLVLQNSPLIGSGSPNKLIDALTAGVPVVQNTTGWIKDMVELEDCGVNVPPGNAEALARAIVAISGDAELRSRLGANARRVAREKFDREQLARKMLLALEGAAGLRMRAAGV